MTRNGVPSPADFRHCMEVCEVDSHGSRRFPPFALEAVEHSRHLPTRARAGYKGWLCCGHLPRVPPARSRTKKSRPDGKLWKRFGPLHVYAPAREYILALKIAAGQNKDLADCAILLPKTQIRTREQAQQVLDQYILLATQQKKAKSIENALNRLFREEVGQEMYHMATLPNGKPIDMDMLETAMEDPDLANRYFLNLVTGEVIFFSEYAGLSDEDEQLLEEIVAPADENAAEKLSIALDGKGAFRRFKDTLHRVDDQWLQAWYQWRDRQVKAAVDE